MDDAAGGSEEISCSHPLQAGIVIVKGQGVQAITAVLHSSASAVAAAGAVMQDRGYVFHVADVSEEAAGEGARVPDTQRRRPKPLPSATDQPPPTMSQRPQG